MEFIKLDTLSLFLFDKNNSEDIIFIKELCKDESIKKWFQGITVGLLKNKNQEFFNHGFIVKEANNYIGYLGIGSYNELDLSVYLRAAIIKEKRGFSYGKILLTEITEYIFKTYDQIESIRLKISKENNASLMTANACGYVWLSDDTYIKYNPYLKQR